MKFSPNRGNVTRTLAVIAMMTLTIGVLGLLLYKERDALLSYEWQINWFAVLAAFGVMGIALAVAALTWTLAMRAAGSSVPFATHMNYYVISHLARRLPGTIWYVAGRNLLYKQHGESARLVTVVSSLEMVLLTIGGAIVAFIFWGQGLDRLPSGYLVAMGIAIALGVLIAQPAVIHWGLRRLGVSGVPQLRYRQLTTWLLLYIFVWLNSGMIFYLLVYAFAGLEPQYMAFAIGSWALVGTLSAVVFFLPSNFGLSEIGISLLLSNVMPSSVAVIVALAVRLALTVFDLFAVGLWLGLGAVLRRVHSRIQAQSS